MNAPNSLSRDEIGRIGKAAIAPGAICIVGGANFTKEARNLINSRHGFLDPRGSPVLWTPAGAEVDFESIATLIGGGLTFDTFVSGGDPCAKMALCSIAFATKEDPRAAQCLMPLTSNL